jgi:hypothetical protein
MMKNQAFVAVLLTVATAACGGGSDAEPDSAAGGGDEMERTVTITFPEEGAVVNGPTVTVQLSTTVPLAPAGEMTEGTGHHHLYLDADLTEPGVPVPTVPNSIVHMGDASSSFTFEFDDMSYGPHRLIAVVADGVHVPLQPWVVDTVNFEVREQQPE